MVVGRAVGRNTDWRRGLCRGIALAVNVLRQRGGRQVCKGTSRMRVFASGRLDLRFFLVRFFLTRSVPLIVIVTGVSKVVVREKVIVFTATATSALLVVGTCLEGSLFAVAIVGVGVTTTTRIGTQQLITLQLALWWVGWSLCEQMTIALQGTWYWWWSGAERYCCWKGGRVQW